MVAEPEMGIRGQQQGGNLRIIGICVVFGVDGDHRAAAAAGGAESAYKARDAALNREASGLQKFAHQPGGLDLLHPQFAEVEDAVVERRNGLGIAFEIIEAKCLFDACSCN